MSIRNSRRSAFRDGLAFDASKGCGLGEDAARIDRVAAANADAVAAVVDPPQCQVDLAQLGEIAFHFRVGDDALCLRVGCILGIADLARCWAFRSPPHGCDLASELLCAQAKSMFEGLRRVVGRHHGLSSRRTCGDGDRSVGVGQEPDNRERAGYRQGKERRSSCQQQPKRQAPVVKHAHDLLAANGAPARGREAREPGWRA